jgi:hypothetical protein
MKLRRDGYTKETYILVDRNGVDEHQRIYDVCQKLNHKARLTEHKPSTLGTKSGTIAIRTNGVSKNRSNYLRNLIYDMEMGAPESKYVPLCFATEPIAVRLNFLAGLIDFDGHAEYRNEEDKSQDAYYRVRIKNSYKDIFDGVVSVANSLLIKNFVSHEVEGTTSRGLHRSFVYNIQLNKCNTVDKILGLYSITYKQRKAPNTWTLDKNILDIRFDVIPLYESQAINALFKEQITGRTEGSNTVQEKKEIRSILESVPNSIFTKMCNELQLADSGEPRQDINK